MHLDSVAGIPALFQKLLSGRLALSAFDHQKDLDRLRFVSFRWLLRREVRSKEAYSTPFCLLISDLLVLETVSRKSIGPTAGQCSDERLRRHLSSVLATEVSSTNATEIVVYDCRAPSDSGVQIAVRISEKRRENPKFSTRF